MEITCHLRGNTGERGGEYDGPNDDWGEERDDRSDGVDGDGRVTLVNITAAWQKETERCPHWMLIMGRDFAQP